MPFYNQHSTVIAGVSSLPTGYTINNSVRFRSSAGAYLSRTTGTSNRRTWTWSGWIKLTKENTTQIFSAGSSSSYVLQARIVTGNGIQIYQDWAGSTVMNIWTGTNTQLRDFSNWYHIVYAVDTTQATSTDRVKIYLNGVQLTAFTNNTYPPQNYELSVNYNPFYIASYLAGVATSSDAYQTEINFIDGQALTADDFGETDATTGVWKPKEYTGTYGTNGFYLPTTATTQAEGFNTVLYTGNTNLQSISGVGFSPDFVWIKNRTGANNHYLYDSIRGTARHLGSQTSAAESSGEQQFTSFDSDGFTVPYDVSGYNNYAGRSYVAWTWDAGANQASTGISSVRYIGEGATNPVKGFGFSPDLVIAKARSAGSPLLYDSVRGAGYFLQPNSTGAESYDITRISVL